MIKSRVEEQQIRGVMILEKLFWIFGFYHNALYGYVVGVVWVHFKPKRYGTGTQNIPTSIVEEAINTTHFDARLHQASMFS
jgi:hypothetical protein